jgi:hypothetical protein
MSESIQPVANVTSTEAAVDTGVSNEVSSDAKGSVGNDPNESFEAFKERIAKESGKGKEPREGKEKSDTDKGADRSADTETDSDTEQEPKQEQEEKAQKAQILKLKVDGKEIDLDLGNVEEVKRLAQMGLSSQKKFQEAAKARSEAEQVIKIMQDNPIELMRHPAFRDKFKEAAEEFLYEDIQKSMMTKEEIEAQANREELERYRRQEQERAETEKTARQQELQNKYRQDYERQFISALEGSGLPKSDWTIQRMAGYMRQAIAQGLSNVTPQDVLHLVRKDWQTAQSELYGNMDGDKLIETLGADIAEKIRRADVAKYKKAQSQSEVQQVKGTPRQPVQKKRFSSVYDMVEDL